MFNYSKLRTYVANIIEMVEVWKKYQQGQATYQELLQLQDFMNKENSEERDSFIQKLWDETPIASDDKAFDFEETLKNVKTAIHKQESQRKAKRQTIILIVSFIMALGVSGYFAYQRFFNQETPKEQIVTPIYAFVEVPKGELYKNVQLPDGSKITLNQGATLKYIKNFKNNREVSLVGEAYFEVVKDNLHPFRVITGELTTTVLGTIFNISHREQRDNIKVTLIEGKIALSDTQNEEVLIAGEQAIYDRKENSFSKVEQATDLALAWKNDIVYFNKASVEEVIEVLEEKYNVYFIIKNKEAIKSHLIYRLNSEKYGFEEVLTHITKITDYKFEILIDGKIIVQPK